MFKVFSIFSLFIFLNLGALSPILAVEAHTLTEKVSFTPPSGWFLADENALPSHVKVMVVGKGASEFSPTINLSTEEFEGTLRDYLKIVKEINSAHGSEWKDLGSIQTKAGIASLSQAETSTEWGKIRMMHVILSRNGVIYILTAAALKNEFPKHYKTFFESLKSLEILPEDSSKELS